MKKCQSSILCWDLNSQPLEHEFPPITTRPGLPPKRNQLVSTDKNKCTHRSSFGRSLYKRIRPVSKPPTTGFPSDFFAEFCTSQSRLDKTGLEPVLNRRFHSKLMCIRFMIFTIKGRKKFFTFPDIFLKANCEKATDTDR